MTAAPEDGLKVAYGDGRLTVTWSMDWVPVGYAVRVAITDADGTPVADLTIDYAPSGDGAVVTGAGLEEGQRIEVRIHAESPDSAPKAVVVVTLAAPPASELANRGGGIRAEWQAVERARSYNVQVLDAEGAPLDPQPPVTGPTDQQPTEAWIDGETLVDGTTYGARVRATAYNSFGDWSEASFIALNRSQPDSPVLRALLERLKALGPDFVLG
ncbi:MAG: hypothetical protein K2X44_02570, partial [Magnetospirillum sp.]|nr:hypothetical protein [Magnetospirillum sp.]